MPAPHPPSDALIARAAELRVAGQSWDAAAAAVGRKPATVRQWATMYALRWHRAVRAAERERLTEATAEAVHTLRKQLRSGDDKAERDAAQKLIAFAAKKREKRRPTKRDPAVAQIAADLAGRPDAELDAIVDDYVRERDSQSKPGEPGA